MGSFAGHLLPGSMFLLVGLWHVVNSISNFVAHPRAFRARVWHPVRWTRGRLRYIELYCVIIGTFVDMCIEFFYSTHMRFVVNGALNTVHMNDFEHAAMLLMFFILGVAALISESTGWLPLPEGGLYVVAAMAFTAEYLLFYFHSTSHAGLEGRYHEILVLLIGLCILCALLSAAFPGSFVVDLASGMAITLQGAWFYLIAYSLYGPLMPEGCVDTRDHLECASESYEVRGQALAHVQLSVLLPCLWLFVLMTFGVAAHFSGHPDLYHAGNPDLNGNNSDKPYESLS